MELLSNLINKYVNTTVCSAEETCLRNSEANASEFVENLEETFSR